jgi:2'-5' RNA ligase
MHLTLAFLGEIPAPTAELLSQTMSEPFGRAPFAIEFGEIGVFPPHGPPRVLWLGVTRGHDALIELQRDVSARLERVDIALEKRPFHPHLTLARWRTSRSADRRRAQQVDTGRSVGMMTVRAVALIESRLSSAGPSYTSLAQAPLGESAAPPLQSSE